MAAYYNEIDPYAAQWLRNLIGGGLLPAGDVDERDIRDVKRMEIQNYGQHHFFAGIGGWPLALRLAGWPDGRPVWTGSCPCGPYSIIGERKAQADARDLWPAWFSLMDEGVPDLFSEQVADAIAFGWYDRLADDLATINKSCWPVVLPACSIGHGNKGERLFIVAAADKPGLERHVRDEREIIKRAVSDRYVAEAGVHDFIEGWDERWRPVKPGIPLLVNGLSERVVRTYSEGFGNAINPQLAAEFVKAFMEVRP